MTNSWPKDTQAALLAFYGTPGSSISDQLVDVIPPFKMRYEGKGDPIRRIAFHRKAASALLAALTEIWIAYGRDQAKIDAAGISSYDGAYNPRYIRGREADEVWSNHAFACAIDINAKDNGFNTGHGTMPDIVVNAFKRQGFKWGGNYKGRTDPMHFELVWNDTDIASLPPAPEGLVATTAQVPTSATPLGPRMVREAVLELAQHSVIASYSWKDRGRAPIGYIKGMALTYAGVCGRLLSGDAMVLAMAAPLTDKEHDALTWFDLHGATTQDRLRCLFTLMIGLGMRETGGNFGEGRDVTAAIPPSSNTVEAGLFQMSWDITNAVPSVKECYNYWLTQSDEDGLASVFHEGVKVTDRQLANFGTGAGKDYQFMAKAKPAFAVEAAALGLRHQRKHWGPINRKEVEYKDAAESLLLSIEALVAGAKPPGLVVAAKPVPVPIPATPSTPHEPAAGLQAPVTQAERSKFMTWKMGSGLGKMLLGLVHTERFETAAVNVVQGIGHRGLELLKQGDNTALRALLDNLVTNAVPVVGAMVANTEAEKLVAPKVVDSVKEIKV